MVTNNICDIGISFNLYKSFVVLVCYDDGPINISLFVYQVGSHHITRTCTGSEVVSCLFCCRFPGDSSSNESGFPDSLIRHFYGKKIK